MSSAKPRWPAGLALVASLLGFTFAAVSTFDYTKHLDRQVHDISCSFIPGLSASEGAENACRAAMYSPYSSIFREAYWGGIPISLFAVGAFAFFTAFSIYLWLAHERAPRRAYQFLAVAGLTPLAVSLVMFIISATRIGQFCKTCMGIYISSILLAVASITLWRDDRREAAELTAGVGPAALRARAGLAPTAVDGALGRPEGGFLLIPTWLVALALFSITPALLYVSGLPNYTTYVAQCGKLEQPGEPNNALIHLAPRGSQPVTMLVDPMCPTCKAFHHRLVAEGIFPQFDTTLVLFPLDNDCNWMLDRPVHPGACMVSKAVLCSESHALEALEWAYDKQDALLKAAKSGPNDLRALIKQRWPGADACLDSKDTNLRLNRMLRYTINNRLPVSTPQLFIGATRLCAEDTDIGLPYAMRKLAPNVRIQ